MSRYEPCLEYLNWIKETKPRSIKIKDLEKEVEFKPPIDFKYLLTVFYPNKERNVIICGKHLISQDKIYRFAKCKYPNYDSYDFGRLSDFEYEQLKELKHIEI